MTITLEAIRAAGGIVHSDGNIFFRDISMLQGLAGAAPALEAPAAPACPYTGFAARYWTLGYQGHDCPPTTGPVSREAYDAGARAALAAAPQAPAAPSAVATQVIENLLQLARIVNTAVEDWGETKEDDTMHVIFHKEQADKLEEILEFFDSLPDAPPEEGVILSGPSRAARVLRAQAAPAAPDGALCYIRPGATLPERHGFEVCRATDAGAMPVTRDGRATAPAAPAVDASRDTARMDWLEAQVVNVRAPLRYGSRDMFWASPEEVDGGPEGPSDLRARIDAAQAAAKGA